MLENFPFKAIVLLALPASGKTTLVKSLRRDYGDGFAIDLDYRGSKKITDKVRALHTQLVNARIEEGCKVITTFDNWIDPMGLDSNVLCVYCLPKDVSILTNRSRARGDSSGFSTEYSKNAALWLEKWVKHADLYRRVPVSVSTSLVLKATIDYTKPWSYYLENWFYDFVTGIEDFLGERVMSGDDDISIEIHRMSKARRLLMKASGLSSRDVTRLLNFKTERLISTFVEGFKDIGYIRRLNCKTGFCGFPIFHDAGLRSKDKIDDIPGGDDYCGSSEC